MLHNLQSALETEPIVVELVPPGHLVQSAIERQPLPVWYRPLGHGPHASTFSMPVPVWKVPGPQRLQAVAPLMDEKLPGKQLVQVDDAGLGVKAPGRQSWQVSALLAPGSASTSLRDSWCRASGLTGPARGHTCLRCSSDRQ